MFDQIKDVKLNKQEIERLDDIFWTEAYDSKSSRDESIVKLFDFFSTDTKHKIETHYWSYWRFFCELCWKELNSLNRQQIEFVFSYQVPMAVMLGHDVLKKLFSYLNINSNDPKSCVIAVKPVRFALFNSGAVLGVDGNEQYTVKEIIDEAQHLANMGNIALKLAEFKDKMLRIFNSNTNNISDKYLTNADLMVVYFNDLIQFFIGVPDENVHYIIDVYFNPELYEEANTAKTTVTPSILAVSSSKKVKYADVVNNLKKQFKFNVNGDTENVGGVMTKLHDLSMQYDDPNITELYYFDEKDSQFKWNEELINKG